jgi:hypothetical protein
MLWPFALSSASGVPVCSILPRLPERLVYGDCLFEQTTLSQRFGPDVPLRLHRYSPGRWGFSKGSFVPECTEAIQLSTATSDV